MGFGDFEGELDGGCLSKEINLAWMGNGRGAMLRAREGLIWVYVYMYIFGINAPRVIQILHNTV